MDSRTNKRSGPIRRIAYVQYTNPAGYPPLRQSSRLLADAGYEVLFLGTGAYGAGTLEFPPHPRITVRLLPFEAEGWRQKLHFGLFSLWVLYWVIRWRPRWLYASDLFSCPVALLATYLPGASVLYHEHDSPVRGNASRLAQLIWSARARAAGRARVCILPNSDRAHLFREQTGARHVETVWNCPATDEVQEERPPRDDGRLSLYYHGSMSPDLLPLALLPALAHFGDRVDLHIVAYVTIGQRAHAARLREQVRTLGLGKQVHFYTPRSRHELWQISTTCDVGLALAPISHENPNLRFLVGASNKPFDYLASGLAVLIPNAIDWQKTYCEPGYGVACDPAEQTSIASAVGWFLDHPRETRLMARRGRDRIRTDWNYEHQFAPIRALIDGGARSVWSTARSTGTGAPSGSFIEADRR